MQPAPDRGVEIPAFLVKTAFGCSLVVFLILVPFTVNNVIQGRMLLALATSSVGVAALGNVWMGYHGRYSLFVNTWLVTPTGATTITYATITLGHPASYWPFLLTLSYYFVLPERRAWIFNVLTIAAIMPATWVVLDPSSAVRFSAVLVGVSLFAFISMREINILHTLLKKQAVTDELTGLHNRVLLEEVLQQSISQSLRTGLPMSIVTMDIDHFKEVNDTLGHDQGDTVLRRLGLILRDRTRDSDMAFRIGGEEFLVLLHATDEEQAAEVAEKLRREVEQAELLPGRPVTISAGACGLRDDMDLEAWTRTCDERLYEAKRAGRNRVVAQHR